MATTDLRSSHPWLSLDSCGDILIYLDHLQIYLLPDLRNPEPFLLHLIANFRIE
jgi:hypothetical protein